MTALRKKILPALIAAIALNVAALPPARACTDVLNAFLSVEKLNENLKKSLVAINDGFQRLDVALSQNDLKTAQSEIGRLIDEYFDFYMKYYQTPPAQFLDDANWQNKLSAVNARIKKVLELVNKGMVNDAHVEIKSAYESFSAIYKDRIPMQEQNVIDMIVAKLAAMDTAASDFLKTGTSEVSIHANNLKSLSERLTLFDSSDENYLKLRRGLTDFMAVKAQYFVRTPITDEVSCEAQQKEIKSLAETVENFLKTRKKYLNSNWFDVKK